MIERESKSCESVNLKKWELKSNDFAPYYPETEKLRKVMQQEKKFSAQNQKMLSRRIKSEKWQS
jgi:hypothetical protein